MLLVIALWVFFIPLFLGFNYLMTKWISEAQLYQQQEKPAQKRVTYRPVLRKKTV